MSDYNKYVMAVNKIFEIVEKMKKNWPDQDNINYIESLEEYKSAVIQSVKLFDTNKSSVQDKITEELGND